MQIFILLPGLTKNAYDTISYYEKSLRYNFIQFHGPKTLNKKRKIKFFVHTYKIIISAFCHILELLNKHFKKIPKTL